MKILSIRKFIVLNLLSTLIFLSGHTQAAVYKWVDESGQTHYTQLPPPEGLEGETIKPPPKVDTEKAIKELQQRQEAIKSINEERSKTAEEQKKKEEDVARQKANCELARDKLTKASGSTRLYGTDAAGNRARLSEEERQARIAAAKKDIDEYCK